MHVGAHKPADTDSPHKRARSRDAAAADKTVAGKSAAATAIDMQKQVRPIVRCSNQFFFARNGTGPSVHLTHPSPRPDPKHRAQGVFRDRILSLRQSDVEIAIFEPKLPPIEPRRGNLRGESARANADNLHRPRRRHLQKYPRGTTKFPFPIPQSLNRRKLLVL